MPNQKILLFKFSGEIFKNGHQPLDLNRIDLLAREIAGLSKKYQLGLVFGGGNIFRGRSLALKNFNPAAAHFIGMTATLVNALAFKAALDALNLQSQIISSFAIPHLVPSSSRLDIPLYLKAKQILIFAGGTGNPFVTTDTTAVIRALEMQASLILKATKVAGVYQSDPLHNPKAKKFDRLSYADYLKIPAALILDKTAATLAAEHNLPIYIFKWQPAILAQAAKLKAAGTLLK